MRALNLRREGRNEELSACGVQRRTGDGERTLDACRSEKAFLETGSETIQEHRVDGIDRHDANLLHLRGFAATTQNFPGEKIRWMTDSGGVEVVAVIVGVGIDLADVARYRFDSAKLAWFSRKVYTEYEMSYAMRKRNWHERLAGFFAAKEATRKAFGHAIPWRWVGVAHERSGKPTIELRGDAAPLFACGACERST